jgi:N-acetylglucosamine kinase-like BadF-type ATPase
MNYLSIDGGGSKCSAIWFDDQLNLLGRGLSDGINATQTPIEKCRDNVNTCLNQLFGRRTPDQFETVYAIFAGSFELLTEELDRRTQVRRIVRFSEAKGGLLAGGLQHKGLLALAGTGSDVFYVIGDQCYSIGGWGPILGDQGSGTWIGQRALEAFAKASDGWGMPTIQR